MKKTQFKIGDKIYSPTGVSYEYSPQEGENAGRTDDGTMWHDYIGVISKIYYDFNDYRDEASTSELINLLDETDCSLTYYDIREKDFRTKSMYVSGDKITCGFINDEFYTEPFQIRFTSNKVD